jgi:hypothetical protein
MRTWSRLSKYDSMLCSLAEAMAVNRGYDEIDAIRAEKLFYDEAERFLKLFQVRFGRLPYDWIEVEDHFPGLLKGVRAV